MATLGTRSSGIWRSRSTRERTCACVLAGLALTVVTSCGRRGGNPTKKDGVSTTAPPQWDLVLPLTDDLPAVALISSNAERALLTADGRILGRKAISDPNLLQNKLRSGKTLVMISKPSAVALDVTTGAEAWTRKLVEVPTLYSIGEKSVAIATESGVDLLDLSSGVVRYHGSTRPGRMYADGEDFVFVHEGRLWLVDGAGHERWHVDAAPNSDVQFGKTTILLVDARRFSEIDRATGRIIATGDRTPPGPVEAEARTDGRDYQVARSGGKLAIVARDAAGRQVWSVPWPRGDVGIIERAFDDGNRLALVEASARRTLLIVDGDARKIVASRPLAPTDRVIALSGSCVAVLWRTTNHVGCVSLIDGSDSWTLPITGEDTALWPLKNGHLLLADSNPLTLSRLDQNGKRAWQVEVPDTALGGLNARADLEKPILVDTSGDRREWVLSAGMAVDVVRSGFRVLDLATGKLHEVRP